MDVYRTKFDQDQLNTEEFWKRLEADEQSENIFAVTGAQINGAMTAQILTLEKGNKLKSRRDIMTTAVRQETVKRYPVQVVEKSAQQMYSDKYEEKMSESKRIRRQNRFGTVLHRKKLNAEDIESAATKHQDEKNSRLAKFLDMVQTRYPQLLHGKSVDDIMLEPEISDRAEFLIDDDTHLFENLNTLFGERFEANLGQECVRQFMELDLSADLRTDKALAKDADRLEKVTAKARAMINMVDRHPEIKESMGPKEKFEFETKLEMAFAFVDYYMVRKDIITDKWYRNHEDSEISMQFERRTEDKVSTPEKEKRYLEQQNLTRKIWTADYLATSLRQFSSQMPDLPMGIMDDGKRKETNGDAASWSNAMNEYNRLKQIEENEASARALERPADELAEHSFKTDAKGTYFTEHYKKNDPVYNAITFSHSIAGTTDNLADIDRDYVEFSNWKALDYLSDAEFTKMMNNFSAFSKKVKTDKIEDPKLKADKIEDPEVKADKIEDPEVNAEKIENPEVNAEKIEDLKNQELEALRGYMKAIVRELPYLKEKYGIGMLLESPMSVNERQREIRDDIGNTQTITDGMKVFKKYGILNENDPADLEMEAVMNHLHASLTAANDTYANVKFDIRIDHKVPSYNEIMKRSVAAYERFLTLTPQSVKLRMRDFQVNPDMNKKVQWTGKIRDDIAKLKVT